MRNPFHPTSHHQRSSAAPAVGTKDETHKRSFFIRRREHDGLLNDGEGQATTTPKSRHLRIHRRLQAGHFGAGVAHRLRVAPI